MELILSNTMQNSINNIAKVEYGNTSSPLDQSTEQMFTRSTIRKQITTHPTHRLPNHQNDELLNYYQDWANTTLIPAINSGQIATYNDYYEYLDNFQLFLNNKYEGMLGNNQIQRLSTGILPRQNTPEQDYNLLLKKATIDFKVDLALIKAGITDFVPHHYWFFDFDRSKKEATDIPNNIIDLIRTSSAIYKNAIELDATIPQNIKQNLLQIIRQIEDGMPAFKDRFISYITSESTDIISPNIDFNKFRYALDEALFSNNNPTLRAISNIVKHGYAGFFLSDFRISEEGQLGSDSKEREKMNLSLRAIQFLRQTNLGYGYFILADVSKDSIEEVFNVCDNLNIDIRNIRFNPLIETLPVRERLMAVMSSLISNLLKRGVAISEIKELIAMLAGSDSMKRHGFKALLAEMEYTLTMLDVSRLDFITHELYQLKESGEISTEVFNQRFYELLAILRYNSRPEGIYEVDSFFDRYHINDLPQLHNSKLPNTDVEITPLMMSDFLRIAQYATLPVSLDFGKGSSYSRSGILNPQLIALFKFLCNPKDIVITHQGGEALSTLGSISIRHSDLIAGVHEEFARLQKTESEWQLGDKSYREYLISHYKNFLDNPLTIDTFERLEKARQETIEPNSDTARLMSQIAIEKHNEGVSSALFGSRSKPSNFNLFNPEKIAQEIYDTIMQTTTSAEDKIKDYIIAKRKDITKIQEDYIEQRAISVANRNDDTFYPSLFGISDLDKKHIDHILKSARDPLMVYVLKTIEATISHAKHKQLPDLQNRIKKADFLIKETPEESLKIISQNFADINKHNTSKLAVKNLIDHHMPHIMNAVGLGSLTKKQDVIEQYEENVNQWHEVLWHASQSQSSFKNKDLSMNAKSLANNIYHPYSTYNSKNLGKNIANIYLQKLATEYPQETQEVHKASMPANNIDNAIKFHYQPALNTTIEHKTNAKQADFKYLNPKILPDDSVISIFGSTQKTLDNVKRTLVKYSIEGLKKI